MLLFSAPLDFDKSVMAEYEAIDEVCWWNETPRRTMVHTRDVDTWVCSPGYPKYVSADMLALYPNLKVLATASTGTNHIDLDACARRGVRVLSLLDDRAGLNTISASAEWTFKLILEGLRLKRPYHELQGLEVGLVGYGRIGQKVAKWCDAFGASVSNYDPYRRHSPLPNAEWLTGLFEQSNVVVICCALTPETTGMIGYDLLKRLPQDAVLVNTARGEVIDHADLVIFMEERPDVRVCLDVVPDEVIGRGEAYRGAMRAAGAYVTDHIAGDTFESRTKAARIILGLLKAELAQERGQTPAGSPLAEVL